MAEKEHELQLREKDESALNDPGLVSAVAANLAEIGGELADEELVVEPTPDSKDTDGDDAAVDDDPADEAPDDDPTPEKEEDSGDVLAEIPAPYLRSAAHFGWDDNAVSDMVKKAGADHVMSMLRDLHTKDNNLTAKFADLGRQDKGKLDTPVPDVGRAADPPAKGKIDIAALREKYGDDDVLVDVIAMQQENTDRLGKKLDDVSSRLADTRNTLTQQEYKQQQDDRKLLDNFFGGNDLEPYKDFYGKLEAGADTWADLSSQQQVNRHQVCKLADDIVRGAGMRGAAMDPGEALARAHAVVSGPIAESVTRRKIMGEVEKRSNARVVRPSKGKATSTPGVVGKSKTREEVLSRANERLASVFK